MPVKFLLDKPNSEKETLILLVFRYSGKVLKYSTEEKIHPKNWNIDKQRVRAISGIQHGLINEWLELLDETVTGLHKKFRNSRKIPSTKEFKEAIKQALDFQEEEEREIEFFEFVEGVINRKASGELRKPDGTRFKEGTITGDKKILSVLRNIETETNYPIRFGTINMELYEKIIKLYQDDAKAQNTIDNIIKRLKAFLRVAVADGLFQEEIVKQFKRMPDNSVENIALYDEYLQVLHELKLSDIPRLENIRDIFLIGCYTCLRFSDFSVLGTPHFDDDFVRITDEKTTTPLVIPMHRFVKEILQRRDNVLPEGISNQKMNKYLKELGQLAGFDKEIIRTEKRGGKAIKKKYRMYELITTHTARRSGATNMILAGIPENVVMQLTGHKTVTSFRKYVKVTKEQAARYLQNHNFFKQ